MISPEAPYPLDGGGALRTASLLQYLASQYDVDLIAFRHPGQQVAEMLPAGLVRHTGTVPLRPHKNTLTAKAARNAIRMIRLKPPLLDRFSGYEGEIEELLQGCTYDVAVLEHFWSAPYLPLAKRHARRAILNLHNVESAWHQSCAGAGSYGRSLVHQCFQCAASRQEKRFLKRSDLTLVASQEDACRVRKIAPETPIFVYPNAMPWRDVINCDPEFSLAFSGNLEYEPNRVGIHFFISRIWPALKARFPALKFRIIGKNAYAIQSDVAGLESVECTGAVEDTFGWLSRSMIAVAPLLSGSGTRLKIIEAWAAQKAVVSTTVGAEGLGATHGQSLLLADTPEDFARAVGELLTHDQVRQNIARNGREEYEQKFTWPMAWKVLDSCFPADGSV
jgi:glycosyltransferase involved in cell wall biosynthesis